jgi:hypothetical protein
MGRASLEMSREMRAAASYFRVILKYLSKLVEFYELQKIFISEQNEYGREKLRRKSHETDKFKRERVRNGITKIDFPRRQI